jgi:glutamine synthetase
MGVPEYFGSMVFNDAEMRKRLSEKVWAALKRTKDDARSLDPGIADDVASAMKE